MIEDDKYEWERCDGCGRRLSNFHDRIHNHWPAEGGHKHYCTPCYNKMIKTKINIYIAGSWDDRALVRQVSEFLERAKTDVIDRLDIVVTEHWWTHSDRGKWREFAQSDFKSIQEAEIFFMINGEKITTGKIIELGMAIQRKIPIYVIGEKITSVFRYFVKKQEYYSPPTFEPKELAWWIYKQIEEETK